MAISAKIDMPLLTKVLSVGGALRAIPSSFYATWRPPICDVPARRVELECALRSGSFTSLKLAKLSGSPTWPPGHRPNASTRPRIVPPAPVNGRVPVPGNKVMAQRSRFSARCAGCSSESVFARPVSGARALPFGLPSSCAACPVYLHCLNNRALARYDHCCSAKICCRLDTLTIKY
jgi:hypothetical protein